MLPDALQPKAYCTKPGPQSFLLTLPGVSTRGPNSERRNYLGEKWPVISTESCDFHAYTFGFFYMPQICDMGQRGAEEFFVLKIPSSGFEPANLGTKGQHATSRPPKPLIMQIVLSDYLFCIHYSENIFLSSPSLFCAEIYRVIGYGAS